MCMCYLPKLSCNRYVNLEFLYGTKFCLDLRACITSPKLDKDLLMFWASLSLVPSAPDLLTLSDPAKSTRFNLPEEKKNDHI